MANLRGAIQHHLLIYFLWLLYCVTHLNSPTMSVPYRIIQITGNLSVLRRIFVITQTYGAFNNKLAEKSRALGHTRNLSKQHVAKDFYSENLHYVIFSFYISRHPLFSFLKHPCFGFVA